MDARSTEDTLFDAILTPHRSLSPAAFRGLMAAIALAFLAVGAVFAAIGAWPVLPFCGLEVLLIWGAFKLNYRDARGYEALRLTPHRLEVARVKPSGRSDRIDFAPPHWLAVDLAERPDGSNRLLLRSHGRSLAIGEFLSPDERADLADALRRALSRLRAG